MDHFSPVAFVIRLGNPRLPKLSCLKESLPEEIHFWLLSFSPQSTKNKSRAFTGLQTELGGYVLGSCFDSNAGVQRHGRTVFVGRFVPSQLQAHAWRFIHQH